MYLLQRTGAGWQFATVAIHDAEDAFRPESCPRQRLMGLLEAPAEDKEHTT